jgi:mRNA degradation ribonuclease J1/J2
VFLNVKVLNFNIVMIYIDKGEINTFALTLSEVTTLVNPYYLFVFEGEYNTAVEPIYWVGDDTSNWPVRYNLFTLEEGVDVTLIKGQYKYSVFESDTPIIVDENTNTDELNLIEEGRMVVAGVAVSSIYD